MSELLELLERVDRKLDLIIERGEPKKRKPKTEGQSIEKDEAFKVFFAGYHKLSGMKESDEDAAFTHWKKLTGKETELALNNYPKYINLCKSTGKGDYIKKARTFLKDKNFNDEFSSSSPSKPKLSF